MAEELLLWHVLLLDSRRHSDCCPESSWRLLNRFIAQPFLCSLLEFESHNNVTFCDQIVPDLIAEVKGGVETKQCPFIFFFFAYLWVWNIVSSLVYLEGGGVGRTW